jgi:hypothetical protein
VIEEFAVAGMFVMFDLIYGTTVVFPEKQLLGHL